MTQTKTLYIFVTSDIPDVYINSIGYCIEHFYIGKVILLGIVKDKGQRAKKKKEIEKIKERISRQISLLQEGKYLFKKKEWQQKDIDIQPSDMLRYAKISEQEIESRTIIYSELEQEIFEFLALNQGCLFDVSAILKGYLVDVYTLLMSKGADNIYVFELKLKDRLYDERELIHRLSVDSGDYEYVNLTKSIYTDGKIIKTQEAETSLNTKVNAFDKALDTFASDFAQTILTIYTLVALLSFIGIAYLVTRSKWNDLEPWTFVIFGTPFLTYLVNLALQSIFKKEFSLKPKNIFDWLKNYKFRKLSEEFKF